MQIFGYMGFLVSVVWIYIVANEIVNLLQTMGRMFNISDAILGLTVLAWGNSIGGEAKAVASGEGS
jgi:sodium/potassium/calcium exchanger 6